MSDKHNPQRRRFLRTLGVGTAAAGAAATLGHVTLAQADAPRENNNEDAPLRYQESEHIRAYYASLRD